MPSRHVLCLDIEGGYGGSSRSLFQSLVHLPDGKIQPEVWCRRSGPIQGFYENVGIPCATTPDMPHVSALPRMSRNLYVFGRYALKHPGSRVFRQLLKKTAEEKFHVIHFNHEGLFLLAQWLRSRTEIPFTMHFRTNLIPSLFARWQARVVSRSIDHAIFITENEQKTWCSLGLNNTPGEVIYNIVEKPKQSPLCHSKIPNDSRFKISSLSNYSWSRGVDRLVETALALAKRGRRDILFVVAGDMQLRGSLPGKLGRIKNNKGSLADYARVMGVADMFLFLGHVQKPSSVLAGCDALLKLSREKNPWGRDVIEALGAGLPVIATGSYNRFVESDKTGMLLANYSADEVAKIILNLTENPSLVKQFGDAAELRIKNLCNGSKRASELANIWSKISRTWPPK